VILKLENQTVFYASKNVKRLLCNYLASIFLNKFGEMLMTTKLIPHLSRFKLLTLMIIGGILL
jgi:hypothetical protein